MASPLLVWLMVVSACGLVARCGGASAMAPDAVTLPLAPGRQLLTLAGFASSMDPAFLPCTPAGFPPDGTSVNTLVTLTQEGGEWVGRSVPPMGDIELHLRGSTVSATGYAVAGTITGTAFDIGLMGVTRDVRVTLTSSTRGGRATFDGELTRSSSFVVGRVTGELRFSDTHGLSSSCPVIQWSMQPY